MSNYNVITFSFHFRLYDGRVLCEFMNEVHEGAIPEEVGIIIHVTEYTIKNVPHTYVCMYV